MRVGLLRAELALPSDAVCPSSIVQIASSKNVASLTLDRREQPRRGRSVKEPGGTSGIHGARSWTQRREIRVRGPSPGRSIVVAELDPDAEDDG